MYQKKNLPVYTIYVEEYVEEYVFHFMLVSIGRKSYNVLQIQCIYMQIMRLNIT